MSKRKLTLPAPVTELEIAMTAALAQLHVMEGFEATDNFYFEFGTTMKKTLTKLLTKKQVAVAKEMAKRELKEMTK